MKRSFLLSFLSGFGLNFANIIPRPQFRGATPAAPKKSLIDKSDLPRGYPGAKLARRAVQKGIGVKHHGLRADGITC